MNERAIRLGNDDALVIAALLLGAAVGRCLLLVAAGTFTGLVQRFLNWNEQSKGATIVKSICGVLVLLGGRVADLQRAVSDPFSIENGTQPRATRLATTKGEK